MKNYFRFLAFAAACTMGWAAQALTMGEANKLAGRDSGNANLLIAQKASLSQNATLQSLSFYVNQGAGKLRLGVYDASGPNGGPGKKLAEGAEITPVLGWNQVQVSPLNLVAGTYWLAYLPSSNSLGFADASNGSFVYYRYKYGAMASTFSATPSKGSAHWSFYASLSTAPVSTDPVPPPVTSSPPPPPPPPVSQSSCALPGYPDASCTGVPAGRVLTVYNGDLVINTANAVIDSMDIRGCVYVMASGVMIKNSKISCAGPYTIDYTGGSGAYLTIQDSTIDCQNHTGATAIGEEEVNSLRNNISGCENGFDTNKNMLIQDNYIHDLATSSESHTDGVQMWDTATGVQIIHNTMLAGDQGNSSVISPRSGQVGTVIQDNLFAGGAYTLFCVPGGGAQHIVNNHFSTMFYPKSGAYGPVTDCNGQAEFRGNVWHETGLPIPAE
jgi:hypothetical protein